MSDPQWSNVYALFRGEGSFVPGRVEPYPDSPGGVDPHSEKVILQCLENGFLNQEHFVDSKSNSIARYSTPYYSGNISKPITDVDNYPFFDGVDDFLYVFTKDLAEFTLGTSDFTIECWFNCACTPNGESIFASNYNSSGQKIISFFFSSGSTTNIGLYPSFLYYNGSTWPIAVYSSIPIVLGNWYHLAVSRVGSNFYLHLNGILAGQLTSSLEMQGLTNYLMLGRRWDTAGTRNYFSGNISHFRFTKGVGRYTTDFSSHFSSRVGSVSIVNEKTQGSLAYNSELCNEIPGKVGSSALSFSRSPIATSIVTSSGIGFNSNFTIEFWAKSNLDPTTPYPSVFGNGAPSWNQPAATIQFDRWLDRGAMTIALENVLTLISKTVVEKGVWNHFAFVRESGVLTLYVNGYAEASITHSGTFTLSYGGSGYFLGCNPWDSQLAYFEGSLDEVRISEVSRYYTPLPGQPAFSPPVQELPESTCSDPNWNSVVFLMNLSGLDNSVNLVDELGHVVFARNGASLTTAAYKFGGSSLYYRGPFGDGWTAYSNKDWAMSSGDFTIECWIKPSFNSMNIVRNSNNTYTTNHWAFAWSGGRFLFYCYNYNSSGTVPMLTGDVLPTVNVFSSPSLPFTLDLQEHPEDPYWNKVVFLLKGGGTSGTIAYRDSTGKTASVSGTPQFSNTQFKFASTSIYFDGSGDRLTFPASSTWDLGDTFTIEFWMYPLEWPGSGNACRLLMFGPNGYFSSCLIQILSGGNIGFSLPAGGISTCYVGSGSATLNEWHHYAFSVNNKICKIFKDGVLVAGPAYVDTASDSGGTNSFYIGYDTVGTVNFNYKGYLSDVRVSVGVARYDSNFSAPTSEPTYPNYSLPKTELLLHFNPSQKTYNSSILLPLHGSEGGSTFSDIGPNSISITKYGNVQTTTSQSKFGDSSAYFDGSGDYLVTGSSSHLSMTTFDFTLEFWIRIATLGSAVYVDGRVVGSEGTRIVIWSNGASNQFTFYVSGANRIVASTVNQANTWYHVAVCRANFLTKLFINGVQEGSPWIDTTCYTDSRFVIGADRAASNNFLNGYIEDFRIVRGAALYTSTFTPPTLNLTSTGTYDSYSFEDTVGHSIYAAGDVKISNAQSKYGGYSGYFDGVGDYLYLTGKPIGWLDFSVEGWIYVTNPALGFALLETRNSDSTEIGFVFYVRSTTKLTFGRGSPFTATEGLTSVSANTWHHIALCRRGGVVRGFLNGNLEFEVVDTRNFTNTAWRMGHIWNASGTWSSGYIDELRVKVSDPVYNDGLPVFYPWMHVALCRASNNWRIFVDGVQSGVTVGSSINLDNSASAILQSGSYNSTRNSSEGSAFYYDSIRVTKGVGRYVSSFTPPVSAFPVPSGADTRWSHTVALLHMNGANNSTTFTDSRGLAAWTASGAAKISTSVTDPWSGSASSAYFEGTTSYIMSNVTQWFNFYNQSFTVEFWTYLAPDISTANYATLFAVYDGGGAGWGTGAKIFAQLSPGSRCVRVGYPTGLNTGAYFLGGLSLDVSKWYHVAVSFDTYTRRLCVFVNGKLDAYAYIGLNFYEDDPCRITIGKNDPTEASPAWFKGYIKDFRVTRHGTHPRYNLPRAFIPQEIPFDSGNPDHYLTFSNISEELNLIEEVLPPITLEVVTKDLSKHFDKNARFLRRGYSNNTAFEIFERPKTKKIKGHVFLVNNPVKKRVFVFNKQTNILIDETWSDPVTGYYEFYLESDMKYYVLAFDESGNFNMVAEDSVLPV